LTPPEPLELFPIHGRRRDRWTAAVHDLTQRAFAPYATLPRPSGALRETPDDVEADLAAGGGLLAYTPGWGEPVGALRWRPEPDHLWVKRVAVDPDHQGRRIGRVLMDACHGIATGVGRTEIRLGVRRELEANRRWYERLGYTGHAEHDDWVELRRAVTPPPFPHRRATVHKYGWPDRLHATFAVDVVEESAAGTRARIPAFTPHIDGQGRIIAITAAPIDLWFPTGEWWVEARSTLRQRIKVDVCTPYVRRADGDLEFTDLCLDVVVRGEGPPTIVDEEELEAAGYPPDLEATARRTAEEVRRRLAGDARP
jgi:ribosomal protein S18 acetylase RimI-like enzyme